MPSCTKEVCPKDKTWTADNTRRKCIEKCRAARSNNKAAKKKKRSGGGSNRTKRRIRICDIRFGDMNSGYLHAESGLMESFNIDPRRSNPLRMLGSGMQSNLTPDISNGVVTPRPQIAMILSSQANNHPYVADELYALPASFRLDEIAKDQKYLVYKVWIAEYMGAQECPDSVSPRKGKHQGRINMTKTAYPLPGSFGEVVAFPPGTLVRYEGNPDKGPIILTEPTNQQIKLPGGKIDSSWRDQYASKFGMGDQAQPQTLGRGDLEYYRKLKKSTHFQGCSDAFIAGLTANAEAESEFNAGAMGDGRKHPAAHGRAYLVENTYYCSFGIFQMNICSGVGRSFAKAKGMAAKDKKQQLYRALTDEETHLEWAKHTIMQIFANKGGCSGTRNAKQWGEALATYFEACGNCGGKDSRGNPKPDSSMIERGQRAQIIYDNRNSGEAKTSTAQAKAAVAAEELTPATGTEGQRSMECDPAFANCLPAGPANPGTGGGTPY